MLETLGFPPVLRDDAVAENQTLGPVAAHAGARPTPPRLFRRPPDHSAGGGPAVEKENR